MRHHDTVTVMDIREMQLGPDEVVYMHRYKHFDHVDGPDCWCSPMEWSHIQCTKMSMRDIADRLAEFFRVH